MTCNKFVGLYPVWAIDSWGELSTVREDLEGQIPGVPVVKHSCWQRRVARSGRDKRWKHLKRQALPKMRNRYRPPVDDGFDRREVYAPQGV